MQLSPHEEAALLRRIARAILQGAELSALRGTYGDNMIAKAREKYAIPYVKRGPQRRDARQET
jgi:hypothetical protein